MNKTSALVITALTILSACSPQNAIEFDVSAPGINDATFVIKDQGRQTLFGQNIRNGKCQVKSVLENEPGFYDLDILKDGDKAHQPFEIYLEPGKYTITQGSNLSSYPKIESTSKKQQEISAYNALYTELGGSGESETAKLNAEFESKSHSLSAIAYKQLLAKISASEEKAKSTQYSALEQFIKRYPQSELAAHFLNKQNYAESPERYLKLFNQLSPAAKNSADGKEVAKALATAQQLQPGQKAPDIAGKVFSGQTFTAITTGKKLILIDFWRSANQLSRSNHDKILSIYKEFSRKGFEVISVSMDTKPLWWNTAVKDDKLPWPQMSDLKGNDSPNAANWAISAIPTYYLVTGDWKIYKKDITLSSINLEVSQYIEKQH